MNKKLTILIFTLLLLNNFLFGQHYFCRNYTLTDGLPDNTINDVFHDSRGFLWIGTNAGVSRFDGKNFKNYTTSDGLASDYIVSITESNNGEIFVGCKNGGLTKIFTNSIFSYTDSSGLTSNNITQLYYSKKFNLLFIGTEDGLNVINNDKIITINEKTNQLDYKLHIINFLEVNDYIYVFTKFGKTFKYNPFLEDISPVLHHKILRKGNINSVFINSKSDTLINRDSKLLEIYNSKFTEFPEFGYINDYVEDNIGNTWIVSSTNTFSNNTIFKFKNGKLTPLNNLLNIESNNVLSVEYNSLENILWIGTKEDGLFLFPLDNYTFYNKNDLQLKNPQIIDLYSDDALWICTEREIVEFNSDSVTNKITFEDFNNVFIAYKRTNLKSKYSYLKDKEGSYEKYKDLIITGKYQYNNPYIVNKNSTPVILPSKSLYKPLKYDIMVNKELKKLTGIIDKKDKSIWIGSNVGIFIYNKELKTLDYIDLDGYNFKEFSFTSDKQLIAAEWDHLIIGNVKNQNSNLEKYNNYADGSPINVNKIVTNGNHIWFSTSDHGIYVKTQNGFISSYDQKTINNNFFNDICLDKYGNIVAAGNNGKIYFLELINDTITSKYEIGSKDGLQGTSIRWINCISNKFYIGTNKGINKLNLELFYNSGIIDIEYINKEHGYTNYSGNVSVIDKYDNLWIGGNKQLIKTHVDDQVIKNKKVNYFIQAIEVNNKRINLQNYSNKNEWNLIPIKTIVLPYNKNSLTFYFDIIHFLDPNSITFSYKLEGLFNEWSSPSKDRKIVFQNLSPGNYTLRIKILNNTAVSSSQELSIKFEIKHPFWANWYFIVIGIIVLFLLTWGIIQIRTNSIKKREKLRRQIAERITEFEMKALRAQMNPHFIFNAINSIQNYMLDNDIDASLNYLSDFAKLIRITLDNISKKKIDLEDELNYLKYYLNLEKMRFDKNFDIEIILPNELKSRKLMIPPMIIQPFIENSIKYGFIYNTKPPKIKLEFQLNNDNYLNCIIEDNGIGREKSKELSKNNKTHNSKSTYITLERFVLLNQTQTKKGYHIKTTDLYDDSGFASGTKVEITIPV